MAHNSRDPGRFLRAGHRRLGLFVLLAIYLSVTLNYGQLNPLGEAPDEQAHMDLIRFIGEQGHLPRSQAERQAAGYKSDSPMLYHILIGAATGWVDYDELRRLKSNDLSPRHLLINDGLSPFALIHTDDETLPYQGIVLAWHLARLASTLISGATLLVIYIIALTIRPGDYWLALSTTAVVAAIPRFHFISSSVNDDNLLGLLSALFTLALLQVWQRPERGWLYVWAGLWTGLALTTKYTPVAMTPLVLVVLALALRRGELGWRMATKQLLVFAATAVLAAAWWFIYLEWNFNQVRELGLVAGLFKPLGFDASTQRIAASLTDSAMPVSYQAAVGDATLGDWGITLFRSFWFMQGEANTRLATVLSLVFLGMCGLAAVGLWRAWQRGEELPWAGLGLLGLQIGLLLPVPLLRFILTRNVAEAGQGRHVLFPAAAAVGLLLNMGISAWLPPKRRHWAGLALAGSMLVLSLVSFFGLVLPAFPARLPVRTSADAAQQVPKAHQIPGFSSKTWYLNPRLGDKLELVSYQVGEINAYGALPVTLFWHSRADVNQSYLVELSLQDKNGQGRSLSLGHPVDGRYPTRAWEAGDVVRDTAWLPLAGLESGDYRIWLRLDPIDGADLALQDKFEVLLEDVTLPAQAILPPTGILELPSGQSLEFVLWQAGQPVSGLPVYKQRAAIPITLAGSQAGISLLGPEGVEREPTAQAGDMHIFLVDALWTSGVYALQVDHNGTSIRSDPILRVQVRPRNFDVPPMSSQVQANFGDEITLLGYDLPQRKVQPGGALPITLYWQARRAMDHHYIVSNHLLNQADLRQWGGRDRAPREYYSTVLWTPGEVVRDDYLVPVDPAAPPGVYRLDIGLYVELAGQSWHAPLVQDGALLETNSVTIAPIKVGGPPPGVTVQNPAPGQPRADNLENLVTLLGYDLGLGPGTLDLTLYWRCEARLPGDYTTFVHVRDAMEGRSATSVTIVAQMDRPPAGGAYPTSLWDPGEIIRDIVQIPVPPHVPAGEYEVIVGLYDFATGRRLLVLDEQGQPLDDHIRLDERITIP